VTLDEALARALGGDTRELYALLSRGSGLPGQRANLTLARAFADVCASAEAGPKLARRMATLSADEAPGGSSLEMLPLAGVLAAGACAVRQPSSRGEMLEVIHDACEDLRFRVRDAAPTALGLIAEREGDALLSDLEPFMDGYFHAAAVLDTLAAIPKLSNATAIAGLVSKALELIDRAPRSATRWPGYKALQGSLERAVVPIALRIGAPLLDVIATFRTNDPHLRALLVRALDDKRLRSRLGPDRARAEEAISGQNKAPRDPRSMPGPTRKRGGGRRR
jgi:hypothetical protein